MVINLKIALIVEGLKDKQQVEDAFKNLECKQNIRVVVTEGTKVNNRVKFEIEDCINNGFKPYILSDPDIAGDSLCSMIQYWYPEIPRIEVETKQCAYFTGKKFKAGIEYSSYKYLRKLLSPIVGIEYVDEEPPICWD